MENKGIKKRIAIALSLPPMLNSLETLVKMEVKEVEQLTKIMASEFGITKANLKNSHKTVKVRTGPKINRNGPCICGSGKKYKKCCLNDK